jgi:hypothetical protein
MRPLAGVVLLAAIAVTASGCGSSHRMNAATTDALTLRVIGSTSLPAGLVKEIDSMRRTAATLKAEVYGPGSRRALVKASSGDLIVESAGERKQRFYLIVLHGHFVAGSHPAGTKAPTGTIETQVWSPTAGVTDTGIGDHLPAAVSQLHRLAVIHLS